MKQIIKFLSFIFLAGIALSMQDCAGNDYRVRKEKADTVLTVSIYKMDDNMTPPVLTDSLLLQEQVNVTELVRYGNQDSITVPFQFSNIAKYADITMANIDRRIAIAVNGEVVYTPVVKMRLDNGACSVVLSKGQALKFLPRDKVNNLLSD